MCCADGACCAKLTAEPVSQTPNQSHGEHADDRAPVRGRSPHLTHLSPVIRTCRRACSTPPPPPLVLVLFSHALCARLMKSRGRLRCSGILRVSCWLPP